MTKKGKETILQGHKDWLAAGSNIITTVTYQCHNLTKVIDEEQMKRMLQDGVRLAKCAVEEEEVPNTRPFFVVGSMGCYGGALADGSEYTGHYPDIKSEQDLMDFHRTKTKILLQQNPDGIALETVPCVMECRAFVMLLKEIQQQQQSQQQLLPACWISLACRNDQELNDGSKIEEALAAIHHLDPEGGLLHAIGINCCDSELVPSLVKRIAMFMAKHPLLKKGIARAIAVYPNSGEEWDAQSKTWKEGTGLRKDDLKDAFAKKLTEAVDVVETIWKELQPISSPRPRLILGGCCRTRPQTIAALREEVDKRRNA